MSDRKHTWLARSLASLVPLGIVVGLWFIPNSDTEGWFPLDRVHNMPETIGMLVLYTVGGLAVLAVLVFFAAAILPSGVKYVYHASRGEVGKAKKALGEWK